MCSAPILLLIGLQRAFACCNQTLAVPAFIVARPRRRVEADHGARRARGLLKAHGRTIERKAASIDVPAVGRDKGNRLPACGFVMSTPATLTRACCVRAPCSRKKIRSVWA